MRHEKIKKGHSLYDPAKGSKGYVEEVIDNSFIAVSMDQDHNGVGVLTYYKLVDIVPTNVMGCIWMVKGESVSPLPQLTLPSFGTSSTEDDDELQLLNTDFA